MSKQKINYITHHKNANMRLIELDLTSTHISLYNALFLLWNNCGFATEMSINRNDVMMLSKIGSNNTYLKCLKELDRCKMINYKPSHNPLIGSKINLCRFDTSSDIVVTEFCTTTDTSSDTTTAPLYKLLNKETIKLIEGNHELVNSNIKKWIKGQNEVKEINFEERTQKFLDWFNQMLKIHNGKQGAFKILSKTSQNNYKQLLKAKVPTEDFESVFKEMIKNDWVVKNKSANPSHFLAIDNFNRYLQKSNSNNSKPNMI